MGESAEIQPHPPAPAGTTSNEPTTSEDVFMEDIPPIEAEPVSPPSLPSPPHATSPEPQQPAAGRPRRKRRQPAHYHDTIPVPPAPVQTAPPQRILPRVRLIVRDTYTSVVNQFGVFRRYWHRPSYDPDASVPTEDLSTRPTVVNDSAASTVSAEDEVPHDSTGNPYAAPWPFENMTVYRIMTWVNNGSVMKSEEQVNELVQKILRASDFDVAHLDNFDTGRENERLSRALAEAAGDPRASASVFVKRYRSTKVSISVPSGHSGEPAVNYEVSGLLHVNLTTLIKSAFSDSLAQYLHFSPFELRHSTSGDAGDSQRLHGELYTSDAFLKAHDEVQRHGLLPEDDPHCTRERMVAALQFALDGTRLANFGNAKAWPIYVTLGNLSKYIRAVPTSGALYHLAYIPSLPSSFAAFGEATCPKWKTQQRDITTHCRPYKYGIVVRCLDGIERRVYPRIFTYSADYPEK
ncbi:hypothetical protein FB107DRAFT_280858 [Schizophyllum commune]